MKASIKVARSNARPFQDYTRVAGSLGIVEGKYEARFASNANEIATALRLRNDVFNIEMRGDRIGGSADSQLEFDAYDFKCRHLIVIDRSTGETIGTYRLNTLETARSVEGFYSASEFTIEDLPDTILQNGIELGRACIAKDHRNTKVLFLLWKALLAYSKQAEKRYFFGCCSIFTQDGRTAGQAFDQLRRGGHLSDTFSVSPKRNQIETYGGFKSQGVKLPPLFELYLKLGARVCSPPMLDREFGTIDFFVVFDVTAINEKYRRMFFR